MQILQCRVFSPDRQEGRPCGSVLRGRFLFSLYGTSSTRLAELMLNLSSKPFSGRILIYKEEGRLREMLFTEGYIVRYEEHYTQKRGGTSSSIVRSQHVS